MRARDRAIGITIGILLGVAIVIVFVFVGSRNAIDDPSISGEGGGAATTQTEPAPEAQP